MHALHKQLQNPLTRERDARDRARLATAFPTLRSCSDLHFLALRRYLDSRPERFFDEMTYETYLDWLQRRDKKNSETLKEYFSRFDAEINRALLFLREINSEEWHDRPLKMERLRQWCEDINRVQSDVTYDFVYVDEESFNHYNPTSFRQLMEGFGEYKERV
jgi:hypothetical protein